MNFYLTIPIEVVACRTPLQFFLDPPYLTWGCLDLCQGTFGLWCCAQLIEYPLAFHDNQGAVQHLVLMLLGASCFRDSAQQSPWLLNDCVPLAGLTPAAAALGVAQPSDLFGQDIQCSRSYRIHNYHYYYLSWYCCSKMINEAFHLGSFLVELRRQYLFPDLKSLSCNWCKFNAPCTAVNLSAFKWSIGQQEK